MNVGKSLYTVLDRLEDRQLITKRRSRTDARRWVYCLPEYITDKNNTTKEDGLIKKDTPLPLFFPSNVELVSEIATGKELEDSQHLFNIDSTVIQHPQNVGLDKNSQTAYETENTDIQNFIQQTTLDEGEREGVEQGHCDRILQIEQIANSSTTPQDTSSQTKSQDSTWGQEAHPKKYQPVEVLNSNGDWVRGYWVHKCIMVANLEGIERKWALVDERGEKYVFCGEIRLPRVG